MSNREPDEEIRILRSQLDSMRNLLRDRRVAMARLLWPHWPDAVHNATTWEMIESEIDRIKYEEAKR